MADSQRKWARSCAALVMGCALFGSATADTGAATWEQLSSAAPQVEVDAPQIWSICACFQLADAPIEYVFFPGPAADATSPLSPVPEPASVALMALGLAAVVRASQAGLRRR